MNGTKRVTKAAAFRAVAGALTAFMVVMMYSAIGFVLMIIKVVTGIDIQSDPAWTTGMSTLASAALGYLIGHQVGAAGRTPTETPEPQDVIVTNADSVAVTTPGRTTAPPQPPLTPSATACDKADCPNKEEPAP